MGIIRKSLSVSTVGLIDFRSDKERIARSTRKTHKAVKAQTREARHSAHSAAQQQAAIAAQQAAAAQRQTFLAQQQVNVAAAQLSLANGGQTAHVPAGWYTNPAGNPNELHWWDGYAWTGQRQPMPLPPN